MYGFDLSKYNDPEAMPESELHDDNTIFEDVPVNKRQFGGVFLTRLNIRDIVP